VLAFTVVAIAPAHDIGSGVIAALIQPFVDPASQVPMAGASGLSPACWTPIRAQPSGKVVV
jgi:hypothetical protein